MRDLTERRGELASLGGRLRAVSQRIEALAAACETINELTTIDYASYELLIEGHIGELEAVQKMAHELSETVWSTSWGRVGPKP